MTRGKKRKGRLHASVTPLLCVLALLFFPSGGAGAEQTVYIENQWNYVDMAMDVSAGIPADAVGRLAQIREKGKLTVATEPYFPPQEYIDESKTGQDRFAGADMMLARLIAERMGVELEIVPLAFSEVLTGVQEGRYDLAVSALAFTQSRAEVLEMSRGYYYSGAETASGMLIRQEDADSIRSLADLDARDIAAQSGSLQEAMAVDSALSCRQFRRLSSVTDVITAVEAGVVDAGITDSESAALHISAHRDCPLRFVPVPGFRLREEYLGDRVAARKGEIQLISFVNGVISEVLEKDLYTDWLSQYAPEG
ncbi:MAG: transporter substrate-binding domain-containing protein [Clostridia bacterium]|nr:transporter substrate-binding domain-containing protein [Clostridia bacterium]